MSFCVSFSLCLCLSIIPIDRYNFPINVFGRFYSPVLSEYHHQASYFLTLVSIDIRHVMKMYCHSKHICTFVIVINTYLEKQSVSFGLARQFAL